MLCRIWLQRYNKKCTFATKSRESLLSGAILLQIGCSTFEEWTSILVQFPRSFGRKLQLMTYFLPKITLFFKKNAFFFKKIWSCLIFVVPLHPLSVESDVLTHSAAIAQLVEHNLAKVGVASSSLVCRSIEMSRTEFLLCFSKEVIEYGKESAVRC